MNNTSSTSDIEEEITALWQNYLNAVVNADIDAFGQFVCKQHYISHVGRGRRVRSRDIYLAGIKEVFDAARAEGAFGDQAALQQRDLAINVLSEDLVLVHFTCLLSDANVQYGISVIFKRIGEGWEAIHSHDSSEAL